MGVPYMLMVELSVWNARHIEPGTILETCKAPEGEQYNTEGVWVQGDKGAFLVFYNEVEPLEKFDDGTYDFKS